MALSICLCCLSWVHCSACPSFALRACCACCAPRTAAGDETALADGPQLNASSVDDGGDPQLATQFAGLGMDGAGMEAGGGGGGFDGGFDGGFAGSR
jgi:hypothetical protein